VSDPPAFDAGSVRAIVFDLDGTLIDSYGPIATSLNHARARFALPPLAVEVVRSHVGRGLETLIAEQVGADRVSAGVRLFRERYAEVFAGGTFALPGVPETLPVLRSNGFRMAVASNKPARFSVAILERLELLECFRCVLGPDLVGSPKPDPGMLRGCMDRMAVRSEETVYVGDMVLDVETAACAGVSVLLVPGGSSSPEELERTGQTLLSSFAALGSILGADASG
jgi:phosphoglycolate phosphatase